MYRGNYSDKTPRMTAEEAKALFKKGSKALGVKRQKRGTEEEDFQKSAAIYLRNVLPASAVFYHIPNGEKRDIKTAAKLKAMGVKAGVPDLEVIYKGRTHYLEVKATDGTLSADQKKTIKELREAGAVVYICQTLEEIEAALENHMPLMYRLTPRKPKTANS